MSPSVTLMLGEDYSAAQWTQQYCSGHVGFCVPVHRNGYFKSFGATASVLWHVEIGPKPVEELGDGPVVVDLKSVDLSETGKADGDVVVIGGKVIGYRAWSDHRHFEISADAALKDPVLYITKALKASE